MSRLTVAQALVRFLANQFSERDGVEQRLIPGCFGIFGHGNVAGVGQALLEYGDEMPCGYHGPSMAAPGYDLYYLNVMAGPGAERAWLICDDPAHAWVRDTWADQPVDPRLPFGRHSCGSPSGRPSSGSWPPSAASGTG